MGDSMYSVTIEGIRPLLMHNSRLANPLDEHTKRMKVITHQKTKTDEDHIAIARLELEGGMYHDEKLGPYLPSDNLQRVLENGAARRKLGPLFKAHVGVDMPNEGAPGFPLEYKGPRDIDGIWANKDFVFTKPARVGPKRVMRTRARFPTGWRCTFRVEVLDDGVTQPQLERAIADAGIYHGLGDWHPRYGRFVPVTVNQIS